MLQKKSNGNETAKYIRIAVLLIYDILAVFLAEIISIWTRFEFSLKNEQCIPYLEKMCIRDRFYHIHSAIP